MNINYSQFLNMIPEVTLMALLVIVFIADFLTAPRVALPVAGQTSSASPRQWQDAARPRVSWMRVAAHARACKNRT